ncbi:MAG: isopeptide-forming domain-containing fimbrial protein [Deltaproteobacteria bacterium]|nr:isopeptide-forming domain-containing fimbrial protein [Deltaproteobacteria bacterium]
MTLLRVSYFLLLLACGVEAPPSVSVPPAPSHTHDHGEQAHGLESGDFPAGQRVGTHGMIVFGDKQGGVFMSHIPMFHRPHDVQAIFRVRFKDAGDYKGELHSFLPDAFSLNDAVNGKVKAMRGTLYRGNFEAGGEALRKITVTIDAVLHANVLGQIETPETLSYWVFGGRFLVHPIAGSEDFDQILTVSIDGPPLADGTVITLAAGNTVAARLTDGEQDATVGDESVTVAVEAVLSELVGPGFDRAP